ncbi:MAG TPA: SapC family protein [Pyrinomonadaceae bacterium]|nr:SapC family protein [Pyrinomonadaceae bacterium]
MARHVLLNNVQHKNLRVVTRHSAEFGDDVGSVVILPTEYREIQREYPIFFRKEPGADDFLSIALLGFAKKENLFLDASGWNARYIPAVIERGPFLIGFQEEQVAGEIRQSPVIHIDLDHPRVSATEGEPLFLAMGGNSPYLQRTATVLDTLHRGLTISKQMFTAFLALDLVIPLKLEINLTADERHQLNGYYTVNEARLRELDSVSLEQLHRAGFLESAYLVMASLNNFQKLVDLKLLRYRARDAHELVNR